MQSTHLPRHHLHCQLPHLHYLTINHGITSTTVVATANVSEYGIYQRAASIMSKNTTAAVIVESSKTSYYAPDLC